jgi:hypothetical protein
MINCFNRAWRRMYPEASPVAVRSRHLLRRVRFHGRNLRQLARTRRMAYVRTRSLSALDHWREEARRLLFEIATRSGLPHPQWMRQLAYASRHAQLRHDPKPYAGPVLMVSATAPIANVYPLPHMGWGRVLAGRVELLEVPCDQVEFWADEPILERVAARIVTLLERRINSEAARPPKFVPPPVTLPAARYIFQAGCVRRDIPQGLCSCSSRAPHWRRRPRSIPPASRSRATSRPAMR